MAIYRNRIKYFSVARRFIVTRMYAAKSRQLPLLAANMREDVLRASSWLDARAEAVHRWINRLIRAHRYSKASARHRRRFFAQDTVGIKLKREQYVSSSTPVEKRTYPAARERFSIFNDATWKEETIEISRRMQAHRKNAEMVLSGAEGPLLP